MEPISPLNQSACLTPCGRMWRRPETVPGGGVLQPAADIGRPPVPSLGRCLQACRRHRMAGRCGSHGQRAAVAPHGGITSPRVLAAPEVRQQVIEPPTR